jgi:hypothetical protein
VKSQQVKENGELGRKEGERERQSKRLREGESVHWAEMVLAWVRYGR